MPRGGKRSGSPGAYPNRSDLNTAVPIRATTGQQYGQAGQQLAAQHALPMAPAPTPNTAPISGIVPPGGASPASAGAAPQGPPLGGAPSPPPPAPIPPGGLGALTSPSTRPGEPVTHGAPVGPGAGPEALPQTINVNNGSISQLLSQIAANTNSPAIIKLAQQARQYGQ